MSITETIRRYTRWLHTRWPAGRVEPLPLVREDGSTNIAGLYIAGDLTGVPLLKLAAESGVRAVRGINRELEKLRVRGAKPQAGEAAVRGIVENLDDAVRELVIIGGGVAGMAAALEARKLGLDFEVIEAAEPFATIVNFPRGKPIFTYPRDMRPAGELQFREQVHPKETLLADLRRETVEQGIHPRIARARRIGRRGETLEVVLEDEPAIRARRVLVAIGRSGDFRRLNVPGESLDKVSNRLHDPKDFASKRVLVVGGGDSALEAAIALAECGAHVTLSYRGTEFTRPKPENIDCLNEVRASRDGGSSRHAAPERPASLRLMLGSTIRQIREEYVVLTDRDGGEHVIGNDYVFTMIGREPPLDFLRRSGVRIRGEWRKSSYVSLVLVLLACAFIFHWKKGGLSTPGHVPVVSYVLGVNEAFQQHRWFPYNVPDYLPAAGLLRVSLGEPGFYYSLTFCLAVVIFGMRRINRRRTPYVTVQTYALMAIQVIPLFLLPYILLPWMGNIGLFDGGAMGWLADQLFPRVDYGHGREYWRAFGLILAWPLFIFNVFTQQPLWAWLAISVVQTFVIIPAIIYFWGKGAYCGWICSCGALAETMGDAHRHKMPHGPGWNRFNMLGQVFLAVAMILLVLRVIGWIWPASFAARAFDAIYQDLPFVNYVWFVDLLWAGILGVGLYWHFSGRVWCRFACPLAALMHIYTRFSRFRIFADKQRCISCNVCTSVCHQGIDVMNFANKGLAMEDPQCVRCSACVQSCPTGVLFFGQVDPRSGELIKVDPGWLAASPVRMVELTVSGKRPQRVRGVAMHVD